MTRVGPDAGAVEALAKDDPSVKGLLFVPTYSNPTGNTTTAAVAARLAGVRAAAEDFTLFADDAYRVHHLVDDHDEAPDLLAAAEAAGYPDRVVVFGSTSKITLAGAGLGFMASSEANIRYLSTLLSAQSIGPQQGRAVPARQVFARLSGRRRRTDAGARPHLAPSSPPCRRS
jgi:DNA-binding transcriptional MocR family regulator